MSDKDLPGGESPAEHEASEKAVQPEKGVQPDNAVPAGAEREAAPAAAEAPPAVAPSGAAAGSRWSRLRRRSVLAVAGASAGLVLAGGAGGFVLGHMAADDGHRGGGPGHARDVRQGGEGFHGPGVPGGRGYEDRQGWGPREGSGRRDGGEAPGGS